MWVRSIFIQHSQQGEFHHLLQEMRLTDTESHFCYLTMSKETFDLLLAKVIYFSDNVMLYLLILCYKVEPWLARSRHCSSHSVRTEITLAKRLAIILRFLATGNSQVRSFVFVDMKTLAHT